MSMAESVKPAARNPERIEHGPQMVFHYFVGGWWSPVASHEEKSLRVWFPPRPMLFENRSQIGGDWQHRLARLAFDRLDFAVPGRSADMKQLAI